MADKKNTKQETEIKTIKFYCSEGSVAMYDVDADEILWSMSLEYSDEVENKLYELLTLVTGAKRNVAITFPGIGAIRA